MFELRPCSSGNSLPKHQLRLLVTDPTDQDVPDQGHELIPTPQNEVAARRFAGSDNLVSPLRSTVWVWGFGAPSSHG